MSYLVANPEDMFSHDEAHICLCCYFRLNDCSCPHFSESDKDICKDWKCLCDKKMAECFHEHYKDYKKKYTGWWWALFNDC